MKKITAAFLVLFVIFIISTLTFHAEASSQQSGTKIENSIGSANQPETGCIEVPERHTYHIDGKNLSLLWITPFLGMLLSIALFPLLAPRVWNFHYGKISLFWWIVFFGAFCIKFSTGTGLFYLLEVYMLEFIPFITLLLALFTVAGGIRLKGDLAGTPAVNTLMILAGGLLASLMGTTGAAVLIIRPVLKANSWRKKRAHIAVFIIFIAANVGGGLTPLGDPPLFLGYLKGVTFSWTIKHMLAPVAFTMTILLVIFFLLDTYFYSKEQNKPLKSGNREKLSLDGIPNMLLLPCITGAVILSGIKMGTAFTLYHVAVPVSLIVQVSLLLLITFISLVISEPIIREWNGFSWEPIKEVAKLFAVIFMTMIAPLSMLKAGTAGPMGMVVRGVIDGNGHFINSHFFWAAGALSSFLDNAPTYLVFFNTAGGNPYVLMNHFPDTLTALSAGAVFMGANTYIGNAPNFMIKSIAEESGVDMPSFFGYMFRFSIPVLIPVFILVTYLFF